MILSKQQLEMCDSSAWDFSDLNALSLNCTLKRSPELSCVFRTIVISDSDST